MQRSRKGTRIGLSLASLALLLFIGEGSAKAGAADAKAPGALSEASQECYDCHTDETPALAEQWKDSAHARKNVGCYECHQAKKGEIDAWEHEGYFISALVTPKDCGRCHEKIAAEFSGSHHAKGGQILGSLDNVLGEIVEGVPAANSGCQQCHGSKIAFETDPKTGRIVRDEEGRPRLDDATWPNSGIGRINPDGSLGTCSACHSRHRFSIEMARRPDNCGKCHLGPDHPQKEIYEESKHGIAFVTADQQGKMHLDAKPWIVGVTYSAAPTCATCHMSATQTQPATHDPGKRLSWTLRPVVSKRMENWEEKRRNMKNVCASCHTTAWIDGHYAQYDRVVTLYNEKFGKPAQRIMKTLAKEGLITPTPFDDKIEWTFFYLWHHEGRRARMGASMMAPDYTQWHGFYEVAERFYMEFIPEAREIAHGNAVATQVIDEVMSMPQHTWIEGLSPEASQKVREYYRKRYGADQVK